MSIWKVDVENTFKKAERRFCLPNKLLVGAGTTNYSPRVLASLFHQSVGPIGKEIYQLKDEIQEMLKYVFQTKNEVTLALQTSGSGGLEAALVNIADPGEKVIIAVSGYWGDRIVQIAKIRNLDVIRIESEPGAVFTLEELEKEIIKHKPVLLFVTHGESSGGTVQSLEGLGDICHKHDCLLAVDAVVTLGGIPIFVDRWKIDVAVSASQKCIGAPPGMAFLTCSPSAVKRMRSVKTHPPFNFDVLALSDAWGCFGKPKRYYITYNPNLLYAVREGLAEIAENGIENVWENQRMCAERFWDGLEKIGLKLYVEKEENRLWSVTAVSVPSNIKWKILLDYLSVKYKVEISMGMGHAYNKAIRVGFMGCNAKIEVVDYVLKILEDGISFCRSNHEHNCYA